MSKENYLILFFMNPYAERKGFNHSQSIKNYLQTDTLSVYKSLAAAL